jgi:hypothetical protein
VSAACFHCGGESTLLCDGIVGWRRVREVTYPAVRAHGAAPTPIRKRWIIDTERDDAMVTCDRPLCEGCAHRAGVTFACGAEPWMETTDHCRDCARRAPGMAPLLDDESLDALRARRQLRRLP